MTGCIGSRGLKAIVQNPHLEVFLIQKRVESLDFICLSSLVVLVDSLLVHISLFADLCFPGAAVSMFALGWVGWSG